MTTSNLPMFNHDDDEAIAAAFHAAGHRMTSQRKALLDVLRAEARFVDAETIHQHAKQQGQNLSIATVYRTLALFKDMQLIDGRMVGENQDREEYRFRFQHETYTLTCKRCGAVVPVESDIVDAFREEVAQTLGVTVLTAHSCFVGYCAHCVTAMEQGAAARLDQRDGDD
ncbi:MAG: transcriptional repressor [Chloroflexi bacterium]|nr:transcriptional repressor [Chloroflexota bacterium]